MARKPKPPAPPMLNRAQKKAYQAAIDATGDQVARLRGDPVVAERDARRAAKAMIDRTAKMLATTPGDEKRMRLAKRGLHD